MTEVEVQTRKWGNSLGIVIPTKIIEEEKLQENQKVIVEIKRVIDLKKLRGFIKFKKSAQEIKDEMRSGWK